MSNRNKSQEVGCMGILSRLMFLIFGLTFILAIGKSFFCEALNLRCIDKETGEVHGVPWLAYGILFGISVLLFVIDRKKYSRK